MLDAVGDVGGDGFVLGSTNVSPMVGKLSEIIFSAVQASRLRNSLSKLSVT